MIIKSTLLQLLIIMNGLNYSRLVRVLIVLLIWFHKKKDHQHKSHYLNLCLNVESIILNTEKDLKHSLNFLLVHQEKECLL